MPENGLVEESALLETIYRARPATVAELTALVRRDEAGLRAGLAALERAGAVRVEADGALRYPDPLAWTTSVIARESAQLREASAATLSHAATMMADLPRLARQWAVGEAEAHAVPVITRHGERATDDLWYETSGESGDAAVAVLPDVSRFLSTDTERAARFAAAFARKDSVRAIVPRAVADDPALRAIARRYAAAGVQFRLLADLPSWFWIDGSLLALPFTWGESWPTSILAIRHTALAQLALGLFERLWAAGTSLDDPEEPWTPLLHLMRQGMTLDAASRTLGINPRTGRRRVSAGMAHYGVSTLFGLGAAWAADRDAPSG
ncbi:hypothetical protein ABCS02_09050 [Microbacterium sp. X-17]|uniref:hypothetical protein n=1 Tax=Microbacterium sp. X-17 TaxID=3144404 RepID=UPI0031F47BF4